MRSLPFLRLLVWSWPFVSAAFLWQCIPSVECFSPHDCPLSSSCTAGRCKSKEPSFEPLADTTEAQGESQDANPPETTAQEQISEIQAEPTPEPSPPEPLPENRLDATPDPASPDRRIPPLCWPTSPLPLASSAGSFSSLAIDAQNNVLAVGMKGAVLVWDLLRPNDAPRRIALSASSQTVKSLAFADLEGKQLLVPADTQIQQFDLTTTPPQVTKTFRGPTTPLLKIALSSQSVFGATESATIWEWDRATASPQGSFLKLKFNGSVVDLLLTGPTRSRVVAAIHTGKEDPSPSPDPTTHRLEVWDLSPRKAILESRAFCFGACFPITDLQTIPGSHAFLLTASRLNRWFPSGKTELPDSYTSEILVDGILGSEAAVTASAIHPAGQRFASGHQSGKIKLWQDLTTPSLHATLSPPTTDRITSLHWSSSGNILAALSASTLHVWTCP